MDDLSEFGQKKLHFCEKCSPVRLFFQRLQNATFMNSATQQRMTAIGT